MLHLGLQPVVVAAAYVRVLVDGAQVWPVRRAPAERYRIGVEGRGEVVHFGAHVGDLHDRISAELPLDPEVPLLNVRILAISGIINHVHARRTVDVDIVYRGGKGIGRGQPVVVPQRPLSAQRDTIPVWICTIGRPSW